MLNKQTNKAAILIKSIVFSISMLLVSSFALADDAFTVNNCIIQPFLNNTNIKIPAGTSSVKIPLYVKVQNFSNVDVEFSKSFTNTAYKVDWQILRVNTSVNNIQSLSLVSSGSHPINNEPFYPTPTQILVNPHSERTINLLLSDSGLKDNFPSIGQAGTYIFQIKLSRTISNNPLTVRSAVSQIFFSVE